MKNLSNRKFLLLSLLVVFLLTSGILLPIHLSEKRITPAIRSANAAVTSRSTTQYFPVPEHQLDKIDIVGTLDKSGDFTVEIMNKTKYKLGRVVVRLDIYFKPAVKGGKKPAEEHIMARKIRFECSVDSSYSERVKWTIKEGLLDVYCSDTRKWYWRPKVIEAWAVL